MTGKPGEKIELFLEVALNGMFGNPGEEAGIITAPNPDRKFRIESLELVQVVATVPPFSSFSTWC